MSNKVVQAMYNDDVLKLLLHRSLNITYAYVTKYTLNIGLGDKGATIWMKNYKDAEKLLIKIEDMLYGTRREKLERILEDDK